MRYEHLQDGQGGMTSTAIPDYPENKSALCSTLGLVAVPQVAQAMHKNLTWSDKLPSWLASILEPKWSEKLAAVSTSKDRAFLPYWSEWVQEMSARWWSLIKTDSAALDLTSLRGIAVNTGAKSWFSMIKAYLPNRNWLRTFLPSGTASVVGSTDSGSIGLQSRKIRIYPEPALAKVWKHWQAACRYCYNQAIAYQRQHGTTKTPETLRNIILQSDLPQWVKEAPCHIKQNAVMEAWGAFQQSKEAKFRSVRDKSHTLQFNNCNFSQGRWYPRLTKGLSFRASEEVPQKCPYGTKLMRVKDRWYAIFPEPVNEQCSLARGVMALDPGVRSFLTGFDGTGFIDMAKGDFGRITRLCYHLDDLQSRLSRAPRLKRRRMRQAAFRLRERIRNLVDECHRKVAAFLTDNYRLIFLPTFESAKMVAKAGRKFGSKTARAMLTWAHYRFQQFLKFQAKKRNVVVVEVSEAYTSKTCTKCGHIHTKLGGAKVFRCPKCNHRLPRDWQGALGILLRALRDTAILFTSGQDAIAAPLSDNAQQCSA
jgi:transposase, IS605 OrfB family, central region